MYLHVNQKIKTMNKKLLAFRVLVAVFIIMNFAVSFKLKSETEVFIMLFAVIFTISYIAAEAVHAFDEAKH
jgi:hypothetical protein